MKIAVGSQNPIKIKAVESAFKKVFGDCEVVAVSVLSGVSEMPVNSADLIKGAENRAREAIKKIKADFGVGLEGGFETIENKVFLAGYATVIDRQGKLGLGGGHGFLMPKKIVAAVNQGKSLGEVMDEITGLENTKQNDGAIGFFTNNLIPRQDSFEKAIICALTRFIKKEIFDK